VPSGEIISLALGEILAKHPGEKAMQSAPGALGMQIVSGGAQRPDRFSEANFTIALRQSEPDNPANGRTPRRASCKSTVRHTQGRVEGLDEDPVIILTGHHLD
jgi:hypothetical protein